MISFPTRRPASPPHPAIVEAARLANANFRCIEQIPRLLKAIDLGCGEGRHTMPLLRAGFDVTAIDINPKHIEELTLRAHGEALSGQLHVRRQSVTRAFEAPDYYDLICSTFCLRYLESKVAHEVIRSASTRSHAGTIMVLVDFLREGEFYQAERDRGGNWPTLGIVRARLATSGWEVLVLDEMTIKTEDRHPGGQPYTNQAYVAIAQYDGPQQRRL